MVHQLKHPDYCLTKPRNVEKHKMVVNSTEKAMPTNTAKCDAIIIIHTLL
jgi:hypothetical protein